MTSHDGLDFGGYKSGYVALLGKPNVGKSTFVGTVSWAKGSRCFDKTANDGVASWVF